MTKGTAIRSLFLKRVMDETSRRGVLSHPRRERVNPRRAEVWLRCVNCGVSSANGIIRAEPDTGERVPVYEKDSRCRQRHEGQQQRIFSDVLPLLVCPETPRLMPHVKFFHPPFR